MYSAGDSASRLVTAETCRDVQREIDRPDPPGPGGGENPDGPGNPGDGPGNPIDDCGVNPNDPTCPVDCSYNPMHPDCGGTITVCEGVDPNNLVCTTYSFSTVPGGGSITRTNTGRQSYSFSLSAEASVNVSLTGMNRDIDCRVNGSSCTNHWGTRDDSWNGRLGNGPHTLTVYPYNYPTGNWTVSISATTVRRASPPGPPPRRADPPTVPVSATHLLPFTVSRQGVSGDQTHGFSLTAETRVSVSLTGMDRDIDCRVNASSCTNRGSTRDDSWSGTLGAGTHTVTVYPYGGGSGSYTLSVSGTGTVTPPPTTPPPTTPPPTTPPPQPPPTTPAPARLSLSSIPDFPNLPSGGSINTVFPAATGGTPPYTYSVSGLPPGITFDSASRRASGTLPTVSVYTNYSVFYFVTDSGGRSASQIFTAGVRP